ncbi:MAG: thioredoxin family protein [Ferruginibacter sp.]
MLKLISKKNFKKEVIEGKGLSLVQFKTDWSGVCQIIEPVYSDLVHTYCNVANFYTVDVEEEAGLDKEYGVMEIPTILFFKSGKIIDHSVGLTSKNDLAQKIENALSETMSGNEDKD